MIDNDRGMDLAHLGHHGILTPTPAETLDYFVDLLGMDVVHEDGDSVYLRCFGDYETWGLKITAAEQAGLEYVSWRTKSSAGLRRRVEWLEANGHAGRWVEDEWATGPMYEFLDPDGHTFRLYWETEKYVAPEGKRPAIPTNFQRYVGRGANVRHVDHVNLLARDVKAARQFWEDGFNLRTYEIILQPDGVGEVGAWMSSTIQGHELIYTQDNSKTGRGRLHHFAYLVDNREEVLRAADIMSDAQVYIEVGPSKHTAIQGFYLYTREPGGNRIEVAHMGYLWFDPSSEPYVWTMAKWQEKPGWGMKTPPEFNLYGTPDVE